MGNRHTRNLEELFPAPNMDLQKGSSTASFIAPKNLQEHSWSIPLGISKAMASMSWIANIILQH
jgi:hypothetical protein